MRLLRVVNNLLFPPRCIFCDSVMDYRTAINVCHSCNTSVPRPEGTHCKLCYRKTNGSYGTDICHRCRSKKPYFDSVCAAFIYEDSVRDCILRLKFRKRTDHAAAMGHYMSELADKNAHMLIPVPISRERLKERGYNQSELFTRAMSKVLDIPMYKDVLIKIKDTQPQSSLEFRYREKNIRGAYKVEGPCRVMGKDIILTDDVTTTRSSLNECARVLKRAGARSIRCVTFAMTEKQ